MAQTNNPELVRNLTPSFHKRGDLALNYSHCIAFIQNIPGLVGFWPTAERDLSGNNHTLTRSGTIETIQYDNNIVPYAQFDASGSAYAFSPDPAAPLSIFDIIGNESWSDSTSHGITMGGWWQVNNLGVVSEVLMAKFLVAGNQKAYRLQVTSTAETLQFTLSDDGIANRSFGSTFAPSANTWFYAVAWWKPSSIMRIYYALATDNDVASEDKTSSVPATLHDSTGQFSISSQNDGAFAYLNGRSSMTFLVRGRIPPIYIETIFDLTSPLFAAT